MITKNPQQVFDVQRSLLAFYQRTDLVKAQDLVDKLKKDAADSLIAAVNQKELQVIEATLLALKGEKEKAIEALRNCLVLGLNQKR